MNKTVALIGCGELGSRHLQGISKVNNILDIFVVEPYVNSIQKAKIRYSETKIIEHNLSFVKTVEELPSEIDIVIVATNSDVRYEIIQKLISSKNVNNLVLEKVLFQKKSHYKDIMNLLDDNSINCWVNHPKRMYKFYDDLKHNLKNADNINISVLGGDWGLACNSLHHLDIFEFLFESEITQLESNLERKLYDTKRANFKEFYGKIIGKISNNVQFELNCTHVKSPYIITITSDKYNISFNEVFGWKIEEKIEENWKHIYQSEKIMEYQSDLTNSLINDIINNNCKLPTFNESAKLHIKFIDLLINHINSFSDTKYDYCPIT
jgi:predicted CoA-binding protein